MKWLVPLLFLLATVQLGCEKKPVILPLAPQPFLETITLAKPRGLIFDAALAVSQKMGLTVEVLERKSGFLRLEMSTLSATQMDQYCRYPFVYEKDLQPTNSFQGWNQRSVEAGTGRVRGGVSLTMLIKEKGQTTSELVLQGKWTARNNFEKLEVNSLRILEDQLLYQLKTQLASETGPLHELMMEETISN